MKLIPVTLNGVEPFVRLSLKDARLEDQALGQDLWQTVVELQPGAYQVCFRTSLWERKESFVVMEGDEALTITPQQIDSVLVRSAAPLQRTSGFREADAAITEEVIRRGPVPLRGQEARGSLFLMLRNPLGNAAEFDITSAWDGITLLGGSGKPAADLARAAVWDLAVGVACVYVELPAGAYRLRLATVDKAFLSQYLFVVPDFQTRVFMLAARRRNPDARSSPSVWANAKISVHFAPGDAEFEPASPSLLAAEELMNILEDDIHPETGTEWTDLLASAQSPNLDLAFCLTRTDPWRGRFDAPPAVLGALSARLTGVPDVAVLACARADGAGISGYRLWVPPMTACAWDAALWAESRDKLAIPADSRCARIALRRITRGPWLRFANSQRRRAQRSKSGREMPSAPQGIDFLEMDFEGLVKGLRERVRSEAAMRIAYGSRAFSMAERRFFDLLCPEAYNLTWRILRDSGKAEPEAGAGDSVDGASDSRPGSDSVAFPSRAELVKALQLPTRAIEALALKAITRICRETLLPTREQLEEFVGDEAALNGAVLEPLQVLSQLKSKLMHCAGDEPVPVLSLVYLRYRGPVGRRWSRPFSFDDVADLLNRLGFIVKDDARESSLKTDEEHGGRGGTRAGGQEGTPVGHDHRNVSAEDIRDELTRAESYLSAPWTTLDTLDPLPHGDHFAERLEITFADPLKYKPGSLCSIRIQPPNLTSPYNQWWKTHEFSYSLSLGMGSDSTRWGQVAEGMEQTAMGETAADPPVERDPEAGRRYFEMVQRTRQFSISSLEARLEALDEY